MASSDNSADSASSSTLSMNKTCFYCRASSALLKPGWRLSSGGSALLCKRCASAYEEGRFCDIFHLDDSGWRDCDTCKKYVHCGCIMSAHKYSLLDIGDGIRCTECISNDILEETKSFKISTKNSPHWTWRGLQGSVEVRPSVDSDKKITEITPGQKDSPFPKSREQPSADSPDAADTPSGSSKSNKKAQSDDPLKVHSLRQYTPKATEEELRHIQKDANSVVVPLFEKTLTVSDADPKNGRLVVPKKCATDYLPKLLEPQGLPIRIQDTRGKDWDFHFRFWPNHNSIMYVLEGFRDYMISNQCQAGDKVSFYRIDPEGKLVIGLKKSTQPTISDRKKHLRRFEKNAKITSGSSK